MKKSLLFLAIGSLLIVSSCKKDSKNDVFDADYSDKSVEAVKSDVENSGIDFIDELRKMNETESMVVISNLSSIENQSSTKSFSNGLISVIANSNDGSLKASNLKEYVEQSNSLEEAMLTEQGTYTYNFITKEFEKSSNVTGSIIFVFPGKSSDLTNNATLTINNAKDFVVSSNEFNMLGEKNPASLHIDLKYIGKELIAADLSASYKPNGLPTNFKVTLSINPFSFTFEAIHNPYTKASVRYTFANASKTLMEYYMEANGNWSDQNVQENQNAPQNILNSANTHFILMNVKIAGKADFKGLSDDVATASKKQMTTSQAMDESVKIINDNIKLTVVYTDNGSKIADAEAVRVGNDLSVQMVFSDKSKIDFNTYAEKSLQKFQDEITKFATELDAKYNL